MIKKVTIVNIRLTVAAGYDQIKYKDYEESYAPVITIAICADDFTPIYNNKEAYHEILSRLKKRFEIIETTKSLN